MLTFSFANPSDQLNDFVINYHYSHLYPHGTDIAFRTDINGRLVGVCLFGHTGGNPKAACILKGYDDPLQYRELTRLVLRDAVQKNSESQFIGWCLRWLQHNRPDLVGVISFSDPKYGHTGGVYRASNWDYLGLQKPDRPHLIINGEDLHPRACLHKYGTSSPVKLRASGLDVKEVDRIPKHCYAYILKSELKEDLKYTVQKFNPKKAVTRCLKQSSI